MRTYALGVVPAPPRLLGSLHDVITVRDDLSFLSGYHSPQVDVSVRLNTNESPLPPPPGFVEELSKRVAGVAWNRYPDRMADQLRQAIAGRHEVSPDQIFVANGSNEVLQTVLLAYAGHGRRVACFEPGYQMHAQISRVVGADVVTFERGPDFALDPTRVAEFLADAQPSIVFLTSPNNPTGRSEPKEMIDIICASCDCLLVVDEAYAEFGRWSALDEVADNRPVVVTRTFSKTWSMAAARLGYLVGPRAVVDSLWRTVLPYHLDAVTQLAGILALEYVDEMAHRVAAIVDERERVGLQIAELGLEVVPSDANFLLFSSGGRDASAVWSALVDRQVLVRDCSGWPGLSGWLRVTIGTSAENDVFLNALKEIVNE
jgi:histidinol-phosphate aminotransferase